MSDKIRYAAGAGELLLRDGVVFPGERIKESWAMEFRKWEKHRLGVTLFVTLSEGLMVTQTLLGTWGGSDFLVWSVKSAVSCSNNIALLLLTLLFILWKLCFPPVMIPKILKIYASNRTDWWSFNTTGSAIPEINNFHCRCNGLSGELIFINLYFPNFPQRNTS